MTWVLTHRWPRSRSSDVGRQRLAVRDAEVGLDVSDPAHARDDGGHVRAGEDEAQRCSGSDMPAGMSPVSASTRSSVWARFSGVKYRLRQSPAGQRRRPRQRARQAALIERHTCDDGDPALPARGKQLVLGVLIEDVVDDLHAVDEPGRSAFSPFVGSHRLRLTPTAFTSPSPLEVLDRTLPPIICRPRVVQT